MYNTVGPKDELKYIKEGIHPKNKGVVLHTARRRRTESVNNATQSKEKHRSDHSIKHNGRCGHVQRGALKQLQTFRNNRLYSTGNTPLSLFKGRGCFLIP